MTGPSEALEEPGIIRGFRTESRPAISDSFSLPLKVRNTVGKWNTHEEWSRGFCNLCVCVQSDEAFSLLHRAASCLHGTTADSTGVDRVSCPSDCPVTANRLAVLSFFWLLCARTSEPESESVKNSGEESWDLHSFTCRHLWVHNTSSTHINEKWICSWGKWSDSLVAKCSLTLCVLGFCGQVSVFGRFWEPLCSLVLAPEPQRRTRGQWPSLSSYRRPKHSLVCETQLSAHSSVNPSDTQSYGRSV